MIYSQIVIYLCANCAILTRKVFERKILEKKKTLNICWLFYKLWCELLYIYMDVLDLCGRNIYILENKLCFCFLRFLLIIDKLLTSVHVYLLLFLYVTILVVFF